MRTQARPRSSQVPRPTRGMRAPCASITRAATDVTTSLRSASRFAASIVPARRVRRIDHSHAALLELSDLDHVSIAEFEVEDRQIGGEMVGLGRAWDRDDAPLHEITQRHLRRTLAAGLADAREHFVPGHLAAG